MPKLTQKSQQHSPLSAVAQNITTQLRERGREMANPDITKHMLSLESLQPHQFSEVARAHDQAVADLKQMYADAGINCKDYTDAQWQSGAIAMLAAGNPSAYAKAAVSTRTPSQEGFSMVDTMAGGFDYRTESAISNEAFDDRELQQNLPFSVVFNIQAARQNEFGEALYPTVVVTPDQAGLDVSVSRTMVFNEVRHDLTGKPTDFQRRNLVEAVIDASILANESTRATPVYIASGPHANTDKFTTDVAAANKTVGHEVIFTAPLKPGIDIGLLGLCQPASVQATGQLDNTDTLDQRLNLEKIYIKFVNAAADESVVAFETARLPRAQFQKSQEGFDREMSLNFITVDLPITSATKDVAGAVAAATGGALNYLNAANSSDRATWIVRLAIKVTGDANLELGNVAVNATAVTIDSIARVNTPDGSITAVTEVTDPGAMAALKGAIPTISMVGYDLLAYRSNLNRRTRGLQVTTVMQNERYMIPLGSPVTCPNPVTATRTSTDMAAPITAARIRNDNNAVTKLLQYADTLNALMVSADRRIPVPSVEGIGRHLVRPFFERTTIVVDDIVASLNSQNRAEDVSAALVNKIREVVYRAYRDSGYQPALDALTGGTGEKPTVLIATDPVIQRHLMVSGDTRTMSIGFDHQIVTSMDSRVYGKIFVTFVRKGQTGPDPLSFGCMAWMPELATNIQVTRNGATITETMVQPRSIHINTLPILMVFDVENLGDAVAARVPVYNHPVP
jgi:hypothetical protein